MHRLSFILLFVSLHVAINSNESRGQFNANDIVITDFFNDILRVNNGSVTPLFGIQQPDNISNLTIANSTTAYVSNFTEIWKVDTQANSVTTLVNLGGTSPSEITMDINGDILVVSSSAGVRRINPATGEISLVHDSTFFNAKDIVASADGYIYATEFFDGLGRIDSNGNWTKLGDWNANFFRNIDMGPDGYLYLSTTFEGGDIYRVNPTSGNGSKIADDVWSSIDDLQVGIDGTIYLAGTADTDNDNLAEDLVMSIDPLTGNWSVLVDENMVGNPQPPFFNPRDIVYFDQQFYTSAIPEPNSGLWIATVTICAAMRRRKKMQREE